MNLVRGAVFLLYVQPQLRGLRLTVKSASPIRDPRILITSHMTRTRWQNDFKLNLGEPVDSDFLQWIRHSYELCEAPSQPPPEWPNAGKKHLFERSVMHAKAAARRCTRKERRSARREEAPCAANLKLVIP